MLLTRGRAASLVFVLMAAGAGAAGSCSAGSASPSSSADARGEEYGVVHPIDGATVDGLSQEGSSGPPDAAVQPDGPLATFTAGWVRVPWASSCPTYEPGPDAGLGGISPLDWVACSTGRPGCMELSVDWGVPQLENAWLFSVEDAPGGGARLALGRDYWASASGYQSESLILDMDGGPVFAMRHDGDYGCHELWLGDFSSGQTAATLALIADASVTQYRQVLGMPEALAGKLAPDYAFCNSDVGMGVCPSVNVMSASTGNSAIVAMYYGQTNNLSLRDRTSGQVDPLVTDAGNRPVYGSPSIVGNAAFYTDWKSIYVWQPGAGEALLVPGSDTTWEHDVATDGNDLVWIEDPRAPCQECSFSRAFFTPRRSPQTSVAGYSTCPYDSTLSSLRLRYQGTKRIRAHEDLFTDWQLGRCGLRAFSYSYQRRPYVAHGADQFQRAVVCGLRRSRPAVDGKERWCSSADDPVRRPVGVGSSDRGLDRISSAEAHLAVDDRFAEVTVPRSSRRRPPAPCSSSGSDTPPSGLAEKPFRERAKQTLCRSLRLKNHAHEVPAKLSSPGSMADGRRHRRDREVVRTSDGRRPARCRPDWHGAGALVVRHRVLRGSRSPHVVGGVGPLTTRSRPSGSGSRAPSLHRAPHAHSRRRTSARHPRARLSSASCRGCHSGSSCRRRS